MDELEATMNAARSEDGTPMRWRQTPSGAVEVLNPSTDQWAPVRFRRGGSFVELDPATKRFVLSNPFPMAPVGETNVGDYMNNVAARGARHADAQVARETQAHARAVQEKQIEEAGKNTRTAIVTFGVVVATVTLVAAVVFGSSQDSTPNA